MIDPSMIRGSVGIEVDRQNSTALEYLPAEKDVAPEVVVYLWIGKKIEKGGESEKEKSRLHFFLDEGSAVDKNGIAHLGYRFLCQEAVQFFSIRLMQKHSM